MRRFSVCRTSCPHANRRRRRALTVSTDLSRATLVIGEKRQAGERAIEPFQRRRKEGSIFGFDDELSGV